MTGGAVLDAGHAVGGLTEFVRRIVALNAAIEHTHGEQMIAHAPVRLMAFEALPFLDREVFNFFAEEIGVTRLAGGEDILAGVHSVGRVVALGAFPGDEGGMGGGEAEFLARYGKSRMGRG